LKKKNKNLKIEIVSEFDRKLNFIKFLVKNKVYKDFKKEYRKKFIDIKSEFKSEFKKFLLERKENEKRYKYIIKLLFFYYIFIYLVDYFVKYYRLYVNYFFDFCIVILKVYSFKYGILYFPQVRWDIEKLRITFLLKNFLRNFKMLFNVRTSYKFNDLKVREEWYIIVFKIFGNVVLFFMHRLPIIFSFLSVLFRFSLVFFGYYVFYVFYYFIENIFKFLVNFYKNFVFVIYLFPLRFNLKIKKFLFRNEIKNYKNFFISSKEFENILDILEKNNIIDDNIVKEFYKKILIDIKQNKFVKYDEIQYFRFLSRIREQKKIMIQVKLNEINKNILIFLSKFFYIYKFIIYVFKFIYYFFKWIFNCIKWIILFIINIFSKRY